MMLSGQSTHSYVTEGYQKALPISETFCFEISLSLKSNNIFKVKKVSLRKH